jgi:hypothetical protein
VFERAGLPEMQDPFEVIRQVTKSLFKGIYEKVLLLVPALIPWTFHWNEGMVPPLTGSAVSVTWVPGQTGFSDGDMDTPAVA